MGIYIKGMQMPENCFDCPFMYGRKYCLSNSKIEFNDPEYSELKRRYDGCPLVSVPAPHGRLIDGDALYDLLINLADNEYTPKVFASWLSYEENAPTVIETEEETCQT